MKTFFALLFLFGTGSAYAAGRLQIQTDQSDVNMWWDAGRRHSYTIGRVGRGEKLTVLRQTTLANGQTWLRVKAEARPGLRDEPIWGWVQSKFFSRVRGTGTESDFCASCNARAEARRAGRLERLPEVAPPPRSRHGFRWPVGGVIRSPFGWRRHPFTGRSTFHKGIDIAGNRGKPVRAAKAGKVVHANSNCREGVLSCGGAAGNMVVIDHGDGTKTQYMHLAQSCRLPAVGQRVSEGAVIGCVGSTGMSTGAHLHFGVISNDKFVDPMSVLPRR